MKSTDVLYDEQSENWARSKPLSLSDFTARPFIFDLCGDVNGANVLDIGCGEGYCAREISKRGAATIKAIDISSEMINRAKENSKEFTGKINFEVGDVSNLSDVESNSVDLVMGVFVYNYLFIDEMLASMKENFRVLKKGGNFVFSVPHPSFPFIKKDKSEPFFFDFDGKGYFTGRNTANEGKIFRTDGQELNVRMIHKLVEDYFKSLKESGFTFMPEVLELKVTEEHVKENEAFFGPLYDIPLHMAFKVTK